MEADLQTHRAFYLTGKKHSAQLDAVDDLKLRPALFAAYRDLTRLRYDYPLVLVDAQPDNAGAQSLSGLVDGMLEKIARGENGERIRKHVLRLEREIRSLVASGAHGKLAALWDQAAAPLAKSDALVAESLKQARANLTVDGEVVDCDASLAFKLIGHAWEITHAQRTKKFAAEVKRLLLKLSDIIKADFNSSSAGKSAESLKAAFGSGPMDAFDFAAMSQLLATSAKSESLTSVRRARIENLIATLSAQKFFTVTSGGKPHAFVFDSCGAALAAYRERLPEAIALARALTVAELEIRGEYSAAKHDALFASFGENGLDARDLARFPDYLVRIDAAQLTGVEQDALAQILAIDLPIKVLVQTDDVIEASPLTNGHLAFSLRSRQLASMALASNGAFVLQSPGANLYALRAAVQRGIDFAGPALYSVFSGARNSNLPAYLVGAAALEARAFPAFTFDPAAGDDWASRFSLAGNPQAAADWPVHAFSYQDEGCQSVAQNLAFTLVDFVACDSRYAKHFARVPKARWHDELISVDAALANTGRAQLENVPCLLMVDADNTLQRVIADEKLIREARRCRASWQSLQELGGIHNSHAEQLLAREKKAWDEAAVAALPVDEVAPAAAAAPAAAPAPAVAVQETSVRSPDEAYIETPRCSTCNECVQLNGKMFAYDGNQQAYIADVNAGSYAQLVQAAENCQVAIIHPGKPRDPSEAGLEDLLKRAEAFM